MDVFSSSVRQEGWQAHPIGSYRSDKYAKSSVLFVNTSVGVFLTSVLEAVNGHFLPFGHLTETERYPTLTNRGGGTRTCLTAVVKRENIILA